MLVPRPYQRQSNKALFDYMAASAGNPGNPLIAWPTGTGKAFGIAMFIKELFAKFPQMRILMSAPTEELVEQNYEELKGYWPTAPVGIYCAGLGKAETHFPITFGTIDSLDGAVAADKFGKIHMMLVDECHRISNKENSRYGRVNATLKARYKHFFIAGWTATDYRMGQGKLTDEGGLFTKVIYDATTLEAFNWFFKEGYLVPPIAAPTHSSISGQKMGMVGGDFNQGQLQDAFEQDKASGAIMAALRESLAVADEEGRDHWICFVPGKQACEDVCEMLDSLGVSATYVHSGLKKSERRERIRDYKKGLYRCMVNNGILTTGFNFKALDFMIMLRKTASASLWIQMLGRGTRPNYADGFDINTREGRIEAIIASGKRNFRVMDFVGNTERLGPINDPVKPKKPGEKKNNDAPIKICDTRPENMGVNKRVGCGAFNHPSVKECFYCDWIFPVAQSIESHASTIALVKEAKSDAPIVEKFPIDRVTYRGHFMGKRPSVLVNYHCGKKVFKQYVCIEHEGYARKVAERWWRDRAPVRLDPVPTTINEALDQIESLRVPQVLLVWTNTKPQEIKGYEY